MDTQAVQYQSSQCRVLILHIHHIYQYFYLKTPAAVGTLLVVEWSTPKIDVDNGRPDFVGTGGGDILAFLLEWSRISWDNFSPTMWELKIGERNYNKSTLSGAFRLAFDSRNITTLSIQGYYVSANIPADKSDSFLLYI